MRFIWRVYSSFSKYFLVYVWYSDSNFVGEVKYAVCVCVEVVQLTGRAQKYQIYPINV